MSRDSSIGNDIFRVASMHRIVIHRIVSIHIDESLHPYINHLLVVIMLIVMPYLHDLILHR